MPQGDPAVVFKPSHLGAQLAVDDNDDEEPAADIVHSAVTAGKEVRVRSWDASLRADDLAR